MGQREASNLLIHWWLILESGSSEWLWGPPAHYHQPLIKSNDNCLISWFPFESCATFFLSCLTWHNQWHVIKKWFVKWAERQREILADCDYALPTKFTLFHRFGIRISSSQSAIDFDSLIINYIIDETCLWSNLRFWCACKWYHLRSNTDYNIILATQSFTLIIHTTWKYVFVVRKSKAKLRDLVAMYAINKFTPNKPLKTWKSWRARPKHIITHSQKHCICSHVNFAWWCIPSKNLKTLERRDEIQRVFRGLLEKTYVG